MSLAGVMPRSKFSSLIIKVVPAPRVVGGIFRRYDEDIIVTLKKADTNHEILVPLSEGELIANFDDLWKRIGDFLQKSILEAEECHREQRNRL